MQATYPREIVSVRQKHPTIPIAPGNVRMDREIFVGDPLDRNDLRHARAVVSTLKGILGQSQASTCPHERLKLHFML